MVCKYPRQSDIKSDCVAGARSRETRLGMKRIEEGRKGRACGMRGGEEGSSWHRLYSFTRSFIVRTPPRGSTKPLAHSELVTRPCGTCKHVCVRVRTHVRTYVCTSFFFRPFSPVRAYRPPSRLRRRRRRHRRYRQGFLIHTPWWTA